MLARPAKLERFSFAQIEGWALDDHYAAFRAYLKSARRMLEKPYPQRVFGVDPEIALRVAEAAIGIETADAGQARDFFESSFAPHRIVSPEAGFLTGFFEPQVKASRKKTAQFCYPIYARPDDLIDLRDHNRPQHIDPSYRFAWQKSDGIELFHDRAAIDGGALEGQGLEIAWLADRVDQFFIHVQGAARLDFGDGSMSRITFAAKSGHPYSSIAKVLCERQGFAPEDMTADKLARWMRENPDSLNDLLAQNRSYIFFREVEGQVADEGPVAAAGCPLTAGRSIAVDRTLHSFGTPFWVETQASFVDSDKPLRRLTVAQDTGSAITGAARADIFMGSGAPAGFAAGRIRHRADLTVLLAKDLA